VLLSGFAAGRDHFLTLLTQAAREHDATTRELLA
jgi:hypothetical protein